VGSRGDDVLSAPLLDIAEVMVKAHLGLRAVPTELLSVVGTTPSTA